MNLSRPMRFFRRSRQEQAERLRLHLKIRLKRVWSTLFPGVPFPVRLSHGVWWLARNDFCSDEIVRGSFETGEHRFLERVLRPGMVFLDLGAHNGFYSLLAAKLVQNGGHVVAFEPSPRERKRLRANVRLNRLFNVEVIATAIGDHDGTEPLFVVDGYETGRNSMREPAVSEPLRAVMVPVTSLDGFVERSRLRPIDFLKIDVEGAELDVLRGARHLLAQLPRPFVLCEIDDDRSQPWGHSSADVFSFLEQRGFVWFGLRKTGELVPISDRESYNLVAVPSERLEQIEELGTASVASSAAGG